MIFLGGRRDGEMAMCELIIGEEGYKDGCNNEKESEFVGFVVPDFCLYLL